MATKATSSKGVRLQRGDSVGGASTVWTTIAEITNFSGPGEKAPQIDATSFDSVAMEFIGGLTDGGEFGVDMNWVGSNAQQQGMRTDSRNGSLRDFKFLLNDHVTTPTTITFSALVTQPPEPSAGVNQVVKAKASLKLSGLPTFAYPP